MKRMVLWVFVLIVLFALVAYVNDNSINLPFSDYKEIRITESITELAEVAEPIETPSATKPNLESAEETEIKINVNVGDNNYAAVLYGNVSSQGLINQMPLTINMSELHGNEKYFYLPKSLPTGVESVTEIHAGDLMLYGSSCLVLFYKDFQTSYSYTRLGYIENATGLADTLGNGDAQVILAIET